MKKKILIYVFVFLCSLVNGYSQKTGKKPDDYNYEVQFIRTGVQGTELIKVYAYGRNEKECIANAKADGIKAILFKGIPGSGMMKPMVFEPNGEIVHESYFKDFLAPNGKYLNFIAISNDGSIDGDDRLKVGKKLKLGILLVVQKDNLRKQLESDGIIKKLDNGF